MEKLDRSTLKFLCWANDHASELGLRIKKLTWPQDWAPNYYEYSAYINWQNQDVYTRGTSLHEDLALVKALAELVERCTQISNGIDISNGMAAHTTTSKAQQKARSELIERDIFINRFATQTPIPRVSTDKAFENHSMKFFYDTLLKTDVNIDVFCLGQYGFEKCVMVVAADTKERFGLSVGLGIDSDFSIALEQAAIESFRRSVWALETKNKEVLTITEFNLLERPTHNDHMKLTLNLDYARDLLNRIRGPYGKFENFLVQQDKFKYKKLFINDPIFKDCPLHIFVASCDTLQQVHTGKFDLERINKDRLFSLNSILKHTTLPLLPHPLS